MAQPRAVSAVIAVARDVERTLFARQLQPG
jgi:hypothetical protein